MANSLFLGRSLKTLQRLFVARFTNTGDPRMDGAEALLVYVVNPQNLSDRSPLARDTTLSGLLQVSTGQLVPPSSVTASSTGGSGTTALYAVVSSIGSQDSALSAVVTAYGPSSLSGGAYNTVAWSPVPGASGYRVLKQNSSGVWQLISGANPLPLGQTSFNDTGSTPAAYAVQTYNPPAPMAARFVDANGVALSTDSNTPPRLITNVRQMAAYLNHLSTGTTDPGDSFSLFGNDTVLGSQTATATAVGTTYWNPSGSSGFDSYPFANLALDATLTAAGGTLTLNLQRLGADAVWYTLWTSGTLNTGSISGALSMEFGPGLPTDIPVISATAPKRGSQSVVLRGKMRLQAVVGTASTTFSISFGGR